MKQKQAEHLWRYRIKQDQLMDSIGLGDETGTIKDVALCILANPGMFLEDIMRSETFRDYGRSTIKRAVAFLHTNGYIKFTLDPSDGRRNLIYFKRV